MEIRIGNGYDIHRLVRNKKFTLGNVDIPFKKGFLAHSDGDVLIHAVIDALLGASNLGNIGILYPDNDIKYKNIDSGILLKDTIKLIKKNGYEIINIDTTVICQKPKLKDYLPDITKKMADLMSVNENQFSIKPKTKEKIDSVGKGKAVEVYAVCLLKRQND